MNTPGLHIVIYTDDADKGGVAQYNHRLACGLVRRGHKVSIVQSRSDGWMKQEQEHLGIRHFWISYDPGTEFTRSIVDTADSEAAFIELRPDLVLFSDCCPVSNMAGKQTALRRGIPYVITVNFVAAYLAERFANCLPVLKKQYAAAAEVIAVSGENLQSLRTRFGLGQDRGVVVYYGVPDAFFEPRDLARRSEHRRRHGLPEDAVISFTAARLSAVKGHVLQLHAMELLAKHAPNVNLISVWAGDGELRGALEAEIAKRDLQKRFRLVGQQSEMAPWYEAADMFVLTSSSEGMPIAIMEAMAKQLPVAATSVSGVPEELADTGALLPDPQRDAAGAVVTLAKAWAEWGANAAIRETAGLRCQDRAKTLFRLESMISSTEKILVRAAAKKNPTATIRSATANPVASN